MSIAERYKDNMKNLYFYFIKKSDIISKLNLIFISLMILLTVFGSLYIHNTWIESKKETLENARTNAVSLEASLNGEMIKQLHGLSEDSNTVAYKSIKKRLCNLITIQKNVRFIYLYTVRNNKIYFIADSEPEYSKDCSPSGQEYTEAKPEDFQPFSTGNISITGPTTDRWGTWISILVPIINYDTGKIIAVLGVDYPAEIWNDEAIYRTYQACIIVIVVLLLIITFYLVLRRTEELHQSKELYRTMIQQSNDMIWTLDKEGNFTFFNHQSEEITGYFFKDWKGKSFATLIVEEDLPRVIEIFTKALEGQNCSYEARIFGKKREIIILYVNTAPMLKDGEIIGTVSFGRDITERKKAEEVILESKTRLQVLFDSCSDAIMLLDENSFFDCNNATLRLFGCATKEEFCSRHPADFSPPTQPDGTSSIVFANNNIARALKKGSDRFEHLHRRLDGTDFPAEVLLDALELNGKNVLQARVFDISERKQAEEELQKYRDHLEELVKDRTSQLLIVNEGLESFSYSVSHDLRAPIRHILGFTDIFNKEFFDKVPVKGQELLDKIIYSAHKMEKLIDDLLNLSRMCRQELHRSNVEMNSIIKVIISEISYSAANKNIEWVISDLPIVFGDKSLLNIVWVNLINNAVKYTGKKDNTIIEIGFKEDMEEFEFYIKDNGVGFDEKYKHKLFEVFQRLHSAEDFEGTGIGLAMVKRIINRHGGRVWAEGEVDKGTIFFFSLPKQKEETMKNKMIPIANKLKM